MGHKGHNAVPNQCLSWSLAFKNKATGERVGPGEAGV